MPALDTRRILNMEISCPNCGSYSVTPTTPQDETGKCEYCCYDCGEYFVDNAPETPQETTP